MADETEEYKNEEVEGSKEEEETFEEWVMSNLDEMFVSSLPMDAIRVSTELY